MVNKYSAKKTEIDWYRFDSKVESLYYLYLKELKEKWLIQRFSLQPYFILQPKYSKGGKNIRAIKYVSDFEIYPTDWDRYIVDIKGMASPQAKMKRKMFDYVYPNTELLWIVRYKWERVSYDDNEKRKRENRKKKKLAKE